MIFKEIERCRICKSKSLELVFDLGEFCLCGYFPAKNEPDPPIVPLQLVKCCDCDLVQLRHSVLPDELYTPGYGYRSGINNTMKNHLKSIVEKVCATVSLQEGDIVLDIGSNDGTLLGFYPPSGIKKIGIDPLAGYFSQFYQDDIESVSSYFTANIYFNATQGEKAKVITSIAMFYDLEDPMQFVGDIKKTLHEEGIWILEQSYLPMMLNRVAFDTICHEHLEYYSLKQLKFLMNENDLQILDVELNEINGGSFCVWVSHKNGYYSPKEEKLNGFIAYEKSLRLDTLAPYEEFKRKSFEVKRKLVGFLEQEKTRGKRIYVYGASTKGNTILQFCGIGKNLIIAAADRNPKKFGRRTPGTGIPIISENEARRGNPDYFLVLPWHFKDEFLHREENFLRKGGHLIFPLPDLLVV